MKRLLGALCCSVVLCGLLVGTLARPDPQAVLARSDLYTQRKIHQRVLQDDTAEASEPVKEDAEPVKEDAEPAKEDAEPVKEEASSEDSEPAEGGAAVAGAEGIAKAEAEPDTPARGDEESKSEPEKKASTEESAPEGGSSQDEGSEAEASSDGQEDTKADTKETKTDSGSEEPGPEGSSSAAGAAAKADSSAPEEEAAGEGDAPEGEKVSASGAGMEVVGRGDEEAPGEVPEDMKSGPGAPGFPESKNLTAAAAKPKTVSDDQNEEEVEGETAGPKSTSKDAEDAAEGDTEAEGEESDPSSTSSKAVRVGPKAGGKIPQPLKRTKGGDADADQESASDTDSQSGVPETVEASDKEDSGNSGVAEEMALDKESAGSDAAKVEEVPFSGPETPVVAVGAPEQQMIEQEALDDEEDYASFMAELFNAGQRLSPAMQGLKEKTQQHVVPKFQEFARSSHEAFLKTSDTIRDQVTPILGPSLSPVAATLISILLLLIPLGLIGALVYHIRFILTLQRLLVLCNLYLCLYCFALLSACIIISGEPMRALRLAAEPNFFVLQIFVAIGYIVYLGLQFWWLFVLTRPKGREKDPIMIAKSVIQVMVAVGIGLHYYIFVFERAMLDKVPRITAWGYLVYCILFLLLILIGRPKDNQLDVGKQT